MLQLDSIIYEGGDTLRNVTAGLQAILLARDPELKDGIEHYLALRDRAGNILLYIGDVELRPVKPLVPGIRWDLQEMMDYKGRYFVPDHMYRPMIASYVLGEENQGTWLLSLRNLDFALSRDDAEALPPTVNEFQGFIVPKKIAEPLRHLTLMVPREGNASAVVERPFYLDFFPLEIIYTEFETRGTYDVNFRTGEMKGNMQPEAVTK